ncbi:hypothetical protein DM02DRAFT_662854 [Periconia macrospinosa]|uniref:Cytochrome P450 n=1 Tax=Periconia macrospinosa TaxID=97972 RepID=A0A2V1D3B6_9PLEO|nr:hypothetical protein DM02DRAFT_662854 [Periconia macrospinosa]
MSLIYEGQRMDSIFIERDPQAHKTLKGPVAQLFSMTNMRNFEVYADECTKIFTDAMRDLQGQAVDFADWLQWYAFDTIGNITFQLPFGFMENRQECELQEAASSRAEWQAGVAPMELPFCLLRRTGHAGVYARDCKTDIFHEIK